MGRGDRRFPLPRASLRNCDAAHDNVPPVYGLPSANSVADCPLRPHSSIRSAQIASVFAFMRTKMPTNHPLAKNGVDAPDTEILRHGGFTRGGFNFDTKVRRQSSDAADLFHGHIGAIDALALALERAATMIESDVLADLKAQRYAGWDENLGKQILTGAFTLQGLAEEAVQRDLRPVHLSGRQEYLENVVNRVIFR